MKKSTWSIPALGAFFVVIALLVSACGSSGVSGNEAANVSGNSITTRAVKHWMYIYAKGNAAEEAEEGESEPVIVPDPPKETQCIAEARAAISTLKTAKAATIKSECNELFTSEYLPKVMQFLIPAYWYQAEAQSQGVTVTDAAVNKMVAKTKKQEIKQDFGGSTSKYNAYLATTGETAADVTWNERVNMVFEKLIKKNATKVTATDVSNYYKSHKSTYGTPARRDMRIVLTKTAATAETAKQALQSGQSWDVVAKKYSTDPTTKDKGGLLTDVTAGEQDAALSKAAFAAKTGVLTGPVKGSFGYYIVEVTKVLPATQKSFAKVKTTIKSTLTQDAEQKAEKTLEAKAKKTYLPKTSCAKLYAIKGYCKNYVAPKTSTTSTTGSTGSTGATGSTGSTATSGSTATTGSTGSTGSSSGSTKKKSK